MLLWMASCLGVALAQDVVDVPALVITPEAVHTYKLEAHLLRPIYQVNTTWRDYYGEFWGGVLVCRNVQARLSSCRFVDDKIYWGFQVAPNGERELHAIPFSGVLEVVWRKKGGVASHDLRGDLAATYDAAAQAVGRLHHTGNGVYRSVDDRRLVGEAFLQRGALNLLAALDVDVGRGRTPTSQVTRMWKALQRFPGSVGSADLEATVAGRVGEAVAVRWSGDATTARGSQTTGIQDVGYAALLKVSGAGRLSVDDGWVERSSLWVAVTRPGNWFDFALSSYRASPWVEGSDPWPGSIPPLPDM